MEATAHKPPYYLPEPNLAHNWQRFKATDSSQQAIFTVNQWTGERTVFDMICLTNYVRVCTAFDNEAKSERTNERF